MIVRGIEQQERRSGSLTARSAVARVARQVPAERGERGPQDFSGVPGPGDRYPGPAGIVIEPERGAIRHRLMDGVEDLRIQVAPGEVDRFRVFPGRSGDPRKRNRDHTGMVPPGRSCQPSRGPGRLRSATWQGHRPRPFSRDRLYLNVCIGLRTAVEKDSLSQISWS